MLKLVNIYPNGPITTINPPIRTALTKFSMDVADIRKCLLANAYVEEILNGSKTIQLTFENYDKDNDPVIDAPKTTPKMVPVNHDVKVDDNIEPEEKTVTPEVNEDPKVEEPVIEDGQVEDSTPIEDETVEETTSEDESAEPVEEQVPIEDAVVEETTEEVPVEDGPVQDSTPVEDRTVEEITSEDIPVDETTADAEDVESVEKTTVVENDNNSYSKKNRKKNNYKRVN